MPLPKAIQTQSSSTVTHNYAKVNSLPNSDKGVHKYRHTFTNSQMRYVNICILVNLGHPLTEEILKQNAHTYTFS